MNLERIFSPRIIGGLPAKTGELPYQVSVRRDGEHYCSGSILSEVQLYGFVRSLMTIQFPDLDLNYGPL